MSGHHVPLRASICQPPTLEVLEPRLLLAADPTVIGDGLDSFLGMFGDSMRENVLALRMPLIGDAMESGVDFLDQMRDALANAYVQHEDAEDPDNPTPANDFVRQVLFDAWHAQKNLLVDEDGEAIAQWQDIAVVEDGGHVQFDCHLFVDIWSYEQTFDFDAAVDFDSGFDVLSMEISGQARLSVGFDWQLNFGQLKEAGEPTEFYVDAAAKADPAAQGEMQFSVEAAIPDLQAQGTFLHMGLNVTDEDADDNPLNDGVDVDGDGLLPSQLRGVFAIDVQDVNGDDRLTDSEMSGLEAADLVDAHVTGGLHREINGYNDVADYCLIDLNLNLDINYGGIEKDFTFGDDSTGAMQLPHFSVDFRLAWFMFEMDTTFNDELGRIDFGADQLDRIPAVEFNHISLNLGQMISKFAGPVLKGYQLITSPIRPVLEWFNTPIPVISDLAGDDSLTLAKLAGFAPKIGPVITVLNDVAQAVQFADAFPEDQDITFDFGSFQLFDDLRSLNELKDDAENILNAANGLLDYLPLGAGGPVSQSMVDFFSQSSGGDYTAGIRFPVLTDPGEIVRFVLGGDASLVELIVPELSVDFSYHASFPIFPPFLNLGLAGGIELGARLGFGFDTYGFARYAESGDENDIFQGFYIKDTWLQDGIEQDLPELYVSVSITGSAFAGIPCLVEAGVRGGVYADVGLNFHDIDGDGRIRFGELEQLAARKWTAIFDAAGEIYAGLEAYVWVGLDLWFWRVTIYQNSWEIAGATLYSFDWGTVENDVPPQLGTLAPANSALMPNGDVVPAGTTGSMPLPANTLLLNIGPRADNRADSGFAGSTDDGNESVTVGQESVEVSDGVFQEMIVVRSMGFEQYFDASLVDNVYAEGGAGNDTIRIMDSVDATGTDGVILRASLFGDLRTDNDDGPEPLDENGDADDLIDNEDKLYLGTGGGLLNGGPGNDRLRGGDGFDYLFGGAGDDHILGGGWEDLIYGGSNDDILRGEDGDDQINGGEGDDWIYGAAGIDRLWGGDGDDLLRGDAGDDFLYGDAGDDKLLGNAGDDSLDGGDGDDTLEGDSGDDSVWGGAGRDIVFGDGGIVALAQLDPDTPSTTLVIPTYSGRDALYGDGGDDAVFGGPSDDTLYGGADDDFLFGDHGLAAGLGDDPEVTSDDDLLGLADPSLLLGQVGDGDPDTIDFVVAPVTGTDGDDVLTGNEGNDVLLGGHGADSLFGGNGQNSATAGSDNDVLVGDGGEVVFSGGSFASVGQHDEEGAGDLLAGNEGDDTLLGGASDDTLVGGRGDDRYMLNPGDDDLLADIAGADELDFSDAAGGIMLDLRLNKGQQQLLDDAGNGLVLISDLRRFPGPDYDQQSIRAALGPAPSSITGGTLILIGRFENVTTTAYDDSVTGDNADNLIVGLGGNDRLCGWLGDDVLLGGDGDDALVGDAGDDQLSGGLGDDTLDGSRGTDAVDYSAESGGVWVDLAARLATDGSGGADALSGLEVVIGSALADVIHDNRAANAIYGGAGDDEITTSGGSDTVYGGAGDDQIISASGVALFVWQAGDGSDAIDATGSNATLQVRGSDDADAFALATADGALRLAGPGAATISAHGLRQLTLDAAAGNDVLTIDDLAALNLRRLEIRLGDGRDRLDASAATSALRAWGDGGDDTFLGGRAKDVFDGGEGSDTIDYSTAVSAVNVNLRRHTAIADGRGNRDTILGCEGIVGSDFGDTLCGDARHNRIDGGWGDDLILGDSGDDTLCGGAGLDRLLGGKGHDLFDGGDGADSFDGGGGLDLIDCTAYLDPIDCDPGAGTITDPWGAIDLFNRLSGLMTAEGPVLFS